MIHKSFLFKHSDLLPPAHQRDAGDDAGDDADDPTIHGDGRPART